MNATTDQELLNDYSQQGSEAAFAELVGRHIDFVYSTALRIVRDGASAQDITQNVFIALAKSAKCLTNRPVLTGWLHQTTRNISANTVRSAIRRSIHEQEATTMNELLTSSNEASWDEIAPQIDEALAELSDSDRDAILLRYFERKSAREMAVALGVSDEAAQKRLNRAMERLRQSLSKRSLNIGLSGLVLMITANGIQSAPADFASGLSSSVLSSVAAAQSITAVLIGKVLALSTLAKAFLSATLVAAAGAGIYEARQSIDKRPNSSSVAQATIQSVPSAEVKSNSPLSATTPHAPTSQFTNQFSLPANLKLRKQDHEPTMAEAEEDLTNAIIGLTRFGAVVDSFPDIWVQRGELCARAGKWSEAVTNIRQALVVAPADPWAGYLLSSALLASGDLAGYQKHSHAMMVTFGDTDNSIVGGRTSEAYLVAPYGDNADLEMSVSLVERKRFYWWREFYEGLAQYRLGNFLRSAEILQTTITKLPTVNSIDRPPCEADCYLVLALARRQLNQGAEAIAAFAHGREVAQTQMPQPGAPDLGPYWWNGVTTRALLKEAIGTVEQWSPHPVNASFTFSLAQGNKQTTDSKAIIPLHGPYSEPPAGPLHIVLNSVTLRNGQMQFTIEGATPGATLCVLASDQLFTSTSWFPVLTNTATATGLSVTIPATNAHQFFRILQTQ